MNMIMFFGGPLLLVIGVNALVLGASKLTLSFGISPLVVGLTIAALVTSAPAVAGSVGAVLDGKTRIAIDNVVGKSHLQSEPFKVWTDPQKLDKLWGPLL